MTTPFSARPDSLETTAPYKFFTYLQSHKEERGYGRVEWGGAMVPLAREGGLYLDISAEVPRVPSYATADGAGLSA